MIDKLCKDLSNNLECVVDYKLEKPKYGGGVLEGKTFRIYKDNKPTSLFINEEFMPLDQKESWDELLKMSTESIQNF
jgi:hypothetical protein